jgi:dihydroflavonol-4-reductase
MVEAGGESLRFLVFGGAGFLGHHLISTLLQEYPCCRVAAFDRGPRPHPPCRLEGDPRVAFHYGIDILRPETYRGRLDPQAACLFNLVGCISYWQKDRDRLYRLNITGVERLFAAAREAGLRRAVHVSSAAAVGYRRHDPRPVDETFPVEWARFRGKHYMLTKRLGEQAALRCGTQGLQVVVVNPCALYGPGDIQDVLHLFRSLAAGQVPGFPPGGNGVVDVRDAARGLVAAWRRGRAGERYILVGENASFQEIMGLASRALGVPAPRIRLPRLLAAARPLVRAVELLSRDKPRLTADEFSFGFLHRYYSADKARRELGWRPRYSLSQSMQSAVDWYRSRSLLSEGSTAEGRQA